MDSHEQRIPKILYGDKSESIITEDHCYDLTRFSEPEAETIMQVLTLVKERYPQKYQSIGLLKESHSIIHKPRYVLFEIIIQRHQNSRSMVDKLAVALAYETKGAVYRKSAIMYFESVPSLSRWLIVKKHNLGAIEVYSKFAKVYEREHEYQKSIYCLKKAMAAKGANRAYFTDEIDRLAKKIETPPRTRKSRVSASQIEFENDVVIAAKFFNEYFQQHERS